MNQPQTNHYLPAQFLEYRKKPFDNSLPKSQNYREELKEMVSDWIILKGSISQIVYLKDCQRVLIKDADIRLKNKKGPIKTCQHIWCYLSKNINIAEDDTVKMYGKLYKYQVNNIQNIGFCATQVFIR